MKYFMLDIETGGTEETDDIIQIGLLELDKAPDGTYTPGRAYERLLHTSQPAKNDWIANHHKDKLPICRRLSKVSADSVRQDIRTFFWLCGVVGPVNLMGLNATTFDIPFMLRAGYLKPEDYHYRIYELRGSFNLAQDVFKCSSDKMYELANAGCPEIVLSNGKAHDALYDCYKQVKTLNGLIRTLANANTRLQMS